MSEWIKRSEQEPPHHEWFIASLDDEKYGLLRWSQSELRFIPVVSFSYWMPLPAPPHRTVTIEINGEDAKDLAFRAHHYPKGPLQTVAFACRKALEGKR